MYCYLHNQNISFIEQGAWKKWQFCSMGLQGAPLCAYCLCASIAMSCIEGPYKNITYRQKVQLFSCTWFHKFRNPSTLVSMYSEWPLNICVRKFCMRYISNKQFVLHMFRVISKSVRRELIIFFFGGGGDWVYNYLLYTNTDIPQVFIRPVALLNKLSREVVCAIIKLGSKQ